jgi:hypothetical protein
MLHPNWNYEAIKEMVSRAKQEKEELETILLDELTRYLEGDNNALFTRITEGDSVSLRELPYIAPTRGQHNSPTPHLEEIIRQADEQGSGLLDLLLAEVRMGRADLEDALMLAFQYGKRIMHMADAFETQQYFDRNIHSCERRAVERELVARHSRQLDANRDDSAAGTGPA